MVHDAEHRGLEYLCLNEGAFDYDDRLVREDDLSLSHRIDVAGELHRGKIASVVLVFLAREELLEELRIHVS